MSLKRCLVLIGALSFLLTAPAAYCDDQAPAAAPSAVSNPSGEQVKPAPTKKIRRIRDRKRTNRRFVRGRKKPVPSPVPSPASSPESSPAPQK